jgi:hypothetical protein
MVLYGFVLPTRSAHAADQPAALIETHETDTDIAFTNFTRQNKEFAMSAAQSFCKRLGRRAVIRNLDETRGRVSFHCFKILTPDQWLAGVPAW